ncbi:hypothetical protein QMK34_11150 [Amycolatopsis sp. H20-H5]|nr:hypothetical protein [Amycolatopsis sp. H20-H5]MEC3975836.1 hypothetical protein [Amycolatopsis sp. H20-H5]
MGLLNEKPPLWLHLIFRAPIALYRVGLGRVIGHRLVRIVHIGRSSGRRRETVLETIATIPRLKKSSWSRAGGRRATGIETSKPPLPTKSGSVRTPGTHRHTAYSVSMKLSGF